MVAGIALALGVRNRRNPATLLITVDHATLPADGYSQSRAHVRSTDGTELQSVVWQIEDGQSLAELEQYDSEARLHAGVTPGDDALVVSRE